MAILLHGTTRLRAERIVAGGPDPKLCGPEGFSTYLEGGPFLFGTLEEYACGQAAAFPSEGGAAILAVDVPDDIIALAVNPWFPLSQGLVQFDEGSGLEQLRAAWPTLWKETRLVECS
jgi:hypothetical protein